MQRESLTGLPEAYSDAVNRSVNDGTLFRKMRYLHLLGVTNFVVDDHLYDLLRAKALEDQMDLSDPSDVSLEPKVILFRGKRVLRKSDMDILC